MNTILHSMHGDTRMFGISFIPIEPSFGTKHRESVMETSFPASLDESVDRGPDLEVSTTPRMQPSLYTALPGMRMRIDVLTTEPQKVEGMFSKRSVYDHYAKMRITPAVTVNRERKKHCCHVCRHKKGPETRASASTRNAAIRD